MYLAYRFERPHFDALLRDWQRGGAGVKPVSELLGAEHLLRFLVKLPELLSYLRMERDETAAVVGTLNDFARFFDRHAAAFFATDGYVPAADDYRRAYDATVALMHKTAAAAADATQTASKGAASGAGAAPVINGDGGAAGGRGRRV